jgi:hypothetical protein
MPREYDDERYLQWYSEFQKLIAEFLDTEGNSKESLEAEFSNAVENADELNA